MIISTPRLLSNNEASFLSSSKPICVNKTVKSMSMELYILQILAIAFAASSTSIKEPIIPSFFVCEITSSVKIPINKIFMPSIFKILHGLNSLALFVRICRFAFTIGNFAHFSKNSSCPIP